jgi:hypothetical protein
MATLTAKNHGAFGASRTPTDRAERNTEGGRSAGTHLSSASPN